MQLFVVIVAKMNVETFIRYRQKNIEKFFIRILRIFFLYDRRRIVILFSGFTCSHLYEHNLNANYNKSLDNVRLMILGITIKMWRSYMNN